jgi:hypothetical protein
MYYNTTTGAGISDTELVDMHDDMLDELYPMITMGTLSWSPAYVLRNLDPIAHRISVSEYIGQLVDDGELTDTPPTADGSVCTDCLIAIANGDTSGISDVDTWSAAVDATDACESGAYSVVITGDESYFSSSRCDYCSDPLAGDRVDVQFIAN